MFAFVGAKFKRPLLIGLIFVFGWEQAALAFPGYLKQFTVMYYLQAIVPHAMPNDGVVSLIQGLFRETPGLPDEPVLAGRDLGRFPRLGGPDRRAQGICAGAVDGSGLRLRAQQASRSEACLSLSLSRLRPT